MLQRLEDLGRKWRLVYACRSRADMAFLEAIETLAPVHLHFDDESKSGFVDIGALIREQPKSAHLYCCGPAPMMAAFELATKDWPRDQVHMEYFTPRPAEGKRGGFTVELARSGEEYFIPEGETILNVLLDAGVDIDYSCELGICGACEQRVISGVPEHRDSILSEEEQAENKRVMICCAGCKTERLVLDM
jgi:ferredoxin